MANHSLGQAIAARVASSRLAALMFRVSLAKGRPTPRRCRLNLESATRRSLAGAKGLRP